jgi:hypothetical protein
MSESEFIPLESWNRVLALRARFESPDDRKDTTMSEERMLKWFKFDHLPVHLQIVSSKFWDCACSVVALVEPGPERTVALRKLLEAKDAAVRAVVHPGG